MKTLVIASALLLTLGVTARAQEPICVIDGARRPPQECGMAAAKADDPLARYLFPVELVMAHQQAIGLTERQRMAIQQAVKDAQGKFVDVQFAMSGEVEKLPRLLSASSPDESDVLDEVDRVLGLEREIKRAQLTLMVRIKNQLTDQQQAALQRLRSKGQDGGSAKIF